MRNTGITLTIAALVFFAMGVAAPLLADDAADAATIEMLCSAPWEVAGVFMASPMVNRLPNNGAQPVASPRKIAVTWSRVRVFQKDGTFTTHGSELETGTWAISGDKIILTFGGDKHTDTFSLPLDPSGVAGTDSSGNPTHVVQLLPSPPPATPEIQQKAADLANAYQKNLVLVSGTEGAGSGFIAVMGKSNFAITNTHIVVYINNASFKTLNNAALPVGAASVAVGRDVFCMAAPAGAAPLEIMQDVDKNAAAGDDVVVLANAEGEGVVKTFTGKILSIGPERVEINAEFVPGYTGSPIIHLKTGKVIGVAMCVPAIHDPVNDVKYSEPILHRYGCRLDNIKGWQAVDWRAFYAQAAEMDKIDVVTSELGIFFGDLALNDGKIKSEQYTNPAIADCFYHWQADTAGKQNDDELNRANRTLVSALKGISQSDVTAARQHISYDYFLRELADEQKVRDSMADGFKKLIDKFSD